jgi:hypothetical protein
MTWRSHANDVRSGRLKINQKAERDDFVFVLRVGIKISVALWFFLSWLRVRYSFREAKRGSNHIKTKYRKVVRTVPQSMSPISISVIWACTDDAECKSSYTITIHHHVLAIVSTHVHAQCTMHKLIMHWCWCKSSYTIHHHVLAIVHTCTMHKLQNVYCSISMISMIRASKNSGGGYFIFMFYYFLHNERSGSGHRHRWVPISLTTTVH